MKKSISILTFLFQVTVTFIALFIIYMVFALLDVAESDLVNEVGFLIFQPLYGFALSGLTIAGCIIVGLPIRFIPTLNEWWLKKPFIIFAGCAIGLVLLVISLNSNFTDTTTVVIDGEERTKEIPDFNLAITGWFLIAFSLLHFYPMAMVHWVRNRIKG